MLRRLAFLLLLLVTPAVSPFDARPSALAQGKQEAVVPRPEVAFVVDVTEPEGGKVPVTMTVSQNTDDVVKVAIPAWAPGAYRIVKYCKAVWNVTAAGKESAALEVSSADDQTWSVKTGRAPTFSVSYQLTVDRSRMNKDHCFLAGPDTYLYVVGKKEAPCSVRFRLPEGWKVGTGLGRHGDVYRERDYDTFIDCPTELGKFELLEFQQDKAKYELVIHAKGPVDGPKLVDMCRRIVREQNRMFGGPPFERYVFLYHFMDGIGGRGLEHLNSTDIMMMYPAIRAEPLLSASVTSHEYFHLWNVKRLRPFELGPFDYAQPVRSKALWFCEGVTSYFGDRTLARCGIWTEAAYLAHLAGEVETLQNNPDRKATSVEKASQVVWDRKDWPRVDYYNKGELLGLLIDLKTRTRSAGRKTFDDVLRYLYDTYCVKPAKEGKGPIGVGFPEDGLLKALNTVTGDDWGDFCSRYVSGVEELPYAGVLGSAGLSVEFNISRTPDLGVDLRGTLVGSVPVGGEAAKAGLRAGDRVAAINDVEVARSTIREQLAKLTVGEEAKVRIVRDEASVEVRLKVGVKERTSCKLRRSPSITEEQKRLLDDWLGKRKEY